MKIPIYKENSVTWDYFIYKAVNGSNHAVEVAYEAEAALVSTKTRKPYGTHPDEVDLNTTFANFIKQNPMPVSFTRFLTKLYEVGLLEEEMQSTAEPFHSNEKYVDLWHSDWKPNPKVLIHDAALYLFNNWSYTTYLHIRNDLESSRDQVVMMLFIVSQYL